MLHRLAMPIGLFFHNLWVASENHSSQEQQENQNEKRGTTSVSSEDVPEKLCLAKPDEELKLKVLAAIRAVEQQEFSLAVSHLVQCFKSSSGDLKRWIGCSIPLVYCGTSHYEREIHDEVWSPELKDLSMEVRQRVMSSSEIFRKTLPYFFALSEAFGFTLPEIFSGTFVAHNKNP